MAEKLPETTKPVRISAIVHKQLSTICKKNGMKIGRLSDKVLGDYARKHGEKNNVAS